MSDDSEPVIKSEDEKDVKHKRTTGSDNAGMTDVEADADDLIARLRKQRDDLAATLGRKVGDAMNEHMK
jgi:hypothetical protein